MTREAFIKVLDYNGYSYEKKGNKIVVTHKNAIMLLNDLVSIPSDVEFNTEDNLYLYGLKDLPSGVIFNNDGNIVLDSLKSISPGVAFNNSGDIRLESLTGCWFWEWNGNIDGIDEKRLLNKMISLGLFER